MIHQHPQDNDVWNYGEDRRIQAWHSKAKQGAREALKAFECDRLLREEEARAKEAARLAAEEVEREAVKAAMPFFPKAETAEEIVKEILLYRGVYKKDLKSKTRIYPVTRARQEIAYWLRRKTRLSLPGIAKRMCVKDHTSALYAVHRYAARHGLEVPVAPRKWVSGARPCMEGEARPSKYRAKRK